MSVEGVDSTMWTNVYRHVSFMENTGNDEAYFPQLTWGETPTEDTMPFPPKRVCVGSAGAENEIAQYAVPLPDGSCPNVREECDDTNNVCWRVNVDEYVFECLVNKKHAKRENLIKYASIPPTVAEQLDEETYVDERRLGDGGSVLDRRVYGRRNPNAKSKTRGLIDGIVTGASMDRNALCWTWSRYLLNTPPVGSCVAAKVRCGPNRKCTGK